MRQAAPPGGFGSFTPVYVAARHRASPSAEAAILCCASNAPVPGTEWAVRRSRIRPEEATMDWNRVEGNWKQVKGAVKQQWGKLTDDDLTQIDGSREKLEGIIQERYGIAKDETRKQIDAWSQNRDLQ
jgi:uncharacterized protein YjbJ (UPF0337 family)